MNNLNARLTQGRDRLAVLATGLPDARQALRALRDASEVKLAERRAARKERRRTAVRGAPRVTDLDAEKIDTAI